jgi:hypothetical protein
LLHIGHVHVGACSWSCRNESASKHWLCVHTVDLHGVTMRKVEMGSLSDMTLEPTSMSGSLAFFITAITLVVPDTSHARDKDILSFNTDCLVMTLRCLMRCVSSSTENFLTK